MQVNKSLLKKIVGLFVVLCFSIVMALSLVACGGKSIESTKIENGQLVITYTDGSVDKLDVDGLTGPQGPQGPVGPQGPQGEAGAAVSCEHSYRTLISTMPYTLDDDAEEGEYCTLSIYTCEKCDLLVAEYNADHDYIETVVAPTCITEGYTAKICTECGHEIERTDIVPALDHDFAEINIFDYHNPDRDVCTYGGFVVKTCQREDCGFTTDPEFKAPEGHHSDAWEVDVAPTALTEGTLIGDCNVCGKVNVTRALPVLGEEYEYALDNENRPAGKENYDNYSYSIVVDGQTFNFGELVGHLCGDERIVGEGYVDSFTAEKYPEIRLFGNQELTCDDYVSAFFVCGDCGENITVNVKKDHVVPTDAAKILTPELPTCDEDGKNWYLCDECGETFYVTVPKLSHDLVYTIAPVAGTDTAIISFECRRDDCLYAGQVNNGEPVVVTVEITKAATCCEAGKKVYSYTPAGATEPTKLEEEIPMLDHLFAKEGDVETRLDDSIDYEYEDYKDKFNFFGNVEIGCGESADAYFVCLDCEQPIAVKVIKSHVEPEDGTKTADVASTCEVAGYYEFTCAICGETDIRVDREKLGHNYTYTISDGTEAGTKKVTGTCTNECCANDGADCDCEDWQVVYDNCTYTSEVVKPATCEEVGSRKYDVTLEDESTKTFYEEIAITAHKYNDADIDEVNAYASNTAGLVKMGNQPANCMGEGGGYFVCDMCNDPIYVKVQGPHTGKVNVVEHAADCENDSYTSFDCTVCGGSNLTEEGINGVVTEAYGHVYAWEFVTEPTEATPGQVKITCEQTACDCDFELVVDIPELNDTDYVKITVEPECDTEGKNVYTKDISTGVGEDKVTISITVVLATTAHDYTDTRTFTYVGADEVSRVYTIKYCADCEAWIIWSIEPDIA